jgi:hypothetical protein
MKTLIERRGGFGRPAALLLAVSMTVPTLAGCGGGGGAGSGNIQAPPGMGQTAQQGGMSNKQKVMLLAGAAALYYLYNKRKNAQQKGPNGKYFRSESTGRIYYRDLKTGEAQWVSPPRQPIQVPANEINPQEYSRYQGYNNQNNGQTFGGYGLNDYNKYQDAVPAQPLF